MHRTMLFLLALLAMPAWASPGSMIRDEILRSEPSSSASKVASVSKGSSVEIVGRHGGWTQVRAGSHTGWVRILSVRRGVSSGSASDLAALAARRDNQVVSVAGVRGLNEEELKAAKYNPQEIKRLDSFEVDQAEATRFAHAANLVARKVPYLPAPKSDAPQDNSKSQFWWEGNK